jgi:hypothetical protein
MLGRQAVAKAESKGSRLAGIVLALEQAHGRLQRSTTKFEMMLISLRRLFCPLSAPVILAFCSDCASTLRALHAHFST